MQIGSILSSFELKILSISIDIVCLFVSAIVSHLTLFCETFFRKNNLKIMHYLWPGIYFFYYASDAYPTVASIPFTGFWVIMVHGSTGWNSNIVCVIISLKVKYGK